MWYQIFLWCLATSVFIHCISACVAFLALRKHSRGVFFPLLVVFIGFLYPVTGGVITSECGSIGRAFVACYNAKTMFNVMLYFNAHKFIHVIGDQ